MPQRYKSELPRFANHPFYLSFLRSGPMGAKVSKHSSSKREPKAVLGSNIRSSSEKSSIIEAIKPAEFLKKRKMKKNRVKRVLQPQECRMTKVRKFSTLEDWLLASPGPSGLSSDCLNGGELCVFKNFSSRVQPSGEREAVPSTAGDMSFSVDLSSADFSCSSFRSQSGKLKKKVRFRLPEESDIVVFYLPEETSRTDQQSF